MRRMVLAGLALALVAGVAPASAVRPAPSLAGAGEAAHVDGARGEGAHDEQAHGREFFDVRDAVQVPPAAASRNAVAELSRRVPTLNVTWNTRFGTVKHVFADEGFLSGPASGVASTAEAERVAREWLGRNAALFGVASGARLQVASSGALPAPGAYAIVFRVVYDRIPTFAGGTLGVNVTRVGAVASAWGDTGPTGAGTLDAEPSLSAADALAVVARAEKVTELVPRIHQASRSRADRLTIFADGGLPYRHNARLVAFPTASGPRLAWRVFFAKAETEMLSTAVDARTGEYLFRNNQVDFAEGKVFENYPGAPKGGAQKVVSFDGDPAASPKGWVGVPLDGEQVLDLHSTFGNNAFAFTDYGRMKLAPAGLALALAQVNPIPEFAPFSPTNSFTYDHANHWGADCTPIVTPEGAPARRTIENPSYVQDRDPAVTNIFYLVNRLHDLSYRYGFTEEFGNFQWHNFGKPGKGMDPVRYSAQAGALNNALNNANMWTPADGGEPADLVDGANTADNVKDYYPPHGNMYLWRSIPGFEAGCADGDFDASIAWHEYTHGITNRMVGGRDDADALSAAQSGAMGEAWSDWVAMSFLHMLGLETRAAEGIYATGNAISGIRNFALDRNPLTYGDFGYGPTGPQVHADGEIWSATLWDMRTALIAKYGRKAGEQIATHLVFDGLALSPRLPSFLDMRNAILNGDKTRYRSKYRALIWSVFAKRGMGVSAKSSGATDVTPTPGFDVPGAGNGILRGVVRDADGGVLPNVRVIVGGFGEGQPNETVRTNAAGQFAVKVAPGTHKLTIGGPGYGLQRQGFFPVSARSTVSRVFTLAKNLASVGYGGRVVSGLGEGDPGLALIDDRESSGQVVTKGTPVVIRLGGSAPASVRAISVAHRPASNSRLRTPTRWLVETSVDGKKWSKLKQGGARVARPRPGVAEWVRSTFAARGIKARFVRLTVLATWGPQAAAALGDVQVFGSAPGVRVANVGGEAPFRKDGTVLLANAGGDSASATYLEWQTVCNGEPPAPLQGLDSFVVELPPSAGDGVHFFEVNNTGGTSTDLDAYFYADDCATLTGRAATGAASESAPLPPGTRWVHIVLFAGTTDGFQVVSRTTLEKVTPPRR